jgi:hypothetical protein
VNQLIIHHVHPHTVIQNATSHRVVVHHNESRMVLINRNQMIHRTNTTNRVKHVLDRCVVVRSGRVEQRKSGVR